MRARILVVDDEPSIRTLLERLLRGAHDVVTASGSEEALAILRDASVDVLVTDLHMPGMDGTGLARRSLRDDPSLPVVVTSGQGTPETFAELLRIGVVDFLVKPFTTHEAQLAVGRALAMRGLRAAGQPAIGGEGPGGLDELAGRGQLIAEVRSAVERIAPSEATVVVEGASGTGKSVVARAMHRLSMRRDGPLVVLGCASLTESLIDGELFGHAAGAFTDAARDRPGALERASGGTLVLDDVATLGEPAQARLVRALSEREVTRLGEDRPRPLDVRVVATSQEPLEALVEGGRLRADLFHRLAVLRLRMPSLRELPREDFGAVTQALLERTRLRLGTAAMTLGDDAQEALRAHDWPGNARELENALERAVLLASSNELSAADFAFVRPGARRLAELPARGLDLAATLDAIEADLIARALERTNGSREMAARLLCLRRTALVQKLKRRRDAHESLP